jgi:hypothetical protein
MKTTKQVLLATGVTIMLIASGCGNVPQQEIDSANAAIEAAQAAGAEVYMAESFTALKDSMMVAMESVEEGKSKFIKNYGEGKEKLATITAMANEVLVQTETRIGEIKTQIEQMVVEINTLVAENRQLVSEAPKGKEGTSALVAIKGEISVIEASVSEAGTMVENGDIMGSFEKLSATKEKAGALNTELKEVIAKYKRAAGIR